MRGKKSVILVFVVAGLVALVVQGGTDWGKREGQRGAEGPLDGDDKERPTFFRTNDPVADYNRVSKSAADIQARIQVAVRQEKPGPEVINSLDDADEILEELMDITQDLPLSREDRLMHAHALMLTRAMLHDIRVGVASWEEGQEKPDIDTAFYMQRFLSLASNPRMKDLVLRMKGIGIEDRTAIIDIEAVDVSGEARTGHSRDTRSNWPGRQMQEEASGRKGAPSRAKD